ncbi:MAG: hypothetical protein JNK79_07105 [Chitinophagaceae bacterium]|nr:hypothetical protein [Chitinophagaceae bacterium]
MWRCVAIFIFFSGMHGFVLAQTVTVETFKPLYTVKVRLVDKTSGQPAAGQTAYVTVPGPVFELRTATSDKSGNATFLLKNLDQPRQLIFQVDNLADSNVTFELDNPIAERFNTEKYSGRVRQVGDTLAFFGKADKEYLLDDYVRFPTMEEVLREFVAEVRVRRSRNRFRIEVLNTPFQNVFFDSEPLVLLDGVPVFDTNKLMEIDPLKIRLIQVVARKYYFGSAVFSGIVSLSSYDGDLAGYQLPHQAVVRDFNPETSIK